MLQTLVLLACIWVWHPSSINGATDSDDISALNVFYASMNSPAQLTNWNSSGGDPCGQAWKGITCSGSSVTEIKLPGLGLDGNFGYQMDKLKSLVELDLSNNNLGGGNTLPYNLPPNLQRLNVAQNQFNGGMPYSISLMAALQYLNLAHNQFQGNLSDWFRPMVSLDTMDLSNNSFAGDLPESFSSLSNLTALYLQNNQFTGHIDVLSNLPLNNLNVANNRFSGAIPNQLQKINNLDTDGNSWSTEAAPTQVTNAPPPPGRRSNPGQRSGGRNINPSHRDGGSSGINGGVIAGIVIAVVVISAVIFFFLVKKKARKSSGEELHSQNQPFDSLAFNEIKGKIDVYNEKSSNALSDRYKCLHIDYNNAEFVCVLTKGLENEPNALNHLPIFCTFWQYNEITQLLTQNFPSPSSILLSSLNHLLLVKLRCHPNG